MKQLSQGKMRLRPKASAAKVAKAAAAEVVVSPELTAAAPNLNRVLQSKRAKTTPQEAHTAAGTAADRTSIRKVCTGTCGPST